MISQSQDILMILLDENELTLPFRKSQLCMTHGIVNYSVWLSLHQCFSFHKITFKKNQENRENRKQENYKKFPKV